MTAYNEKLDLAQDKRDFLGKGMCFGFASSFTEYIL